MLIEYRSRINTWSNHFLDSKCFDISYLFEFKQGFWDWLLIFFIVEWSRDVFIMKLNIELASDSMQMLSLNASGDP